MGEDLVGVGWVMQGWGGSCRGGMGWGRLNDGGSCRGRVGWGGWEVKVMMGWGGMGSVL